MQQCSMCRVRAASRHTNVTLRNGAASSDGGALYPLSPNQSRVYEARSRIPRCPTTRSWLDSYAEAAGCREGRW
eukprot:2317763-Rhodomonas_salina.1